MVDYIPLVIIFCINFCTHFALLLKGAMEAAMVAATEVAMEGATAMGDMVAMERVAPHPPMMLIVLLFSAHSYWQTGKRSRYLPLF